MANFKMEGFMFITEAGVAAYWSMMESVGSVSLLWDTSNQERADILMQEKDFDMTKYILRTIPCAVNDEAFDVALTTLHDELCDARFGMEYAFIMNKDEFCNNQTDPVRFMQNFSALPSCGVYSPTVYYPLPEKQIFQTMDELAAFCMDSFTMEGGLEEVVVRIVAEIDEDDSSDGQVAQSFDYKITGAGDHNILQEIVTTLKEWGYSIIIIRIK